MRRNTVRIEKCNIQTHFSSHCLSLSITISPLIIYSQTFFPPPSSPRFLVHFLLPLLLASSGCSFPCPLRVLYSPQSPHPHTHSLCVALATSLADSRSLLLSVPPLSHRQSHPRLLRPLPPRCQSDHLTTSESFFKFGPLIGFLLRLSS